MKTKYTLLFIFLCAINFLNAQVDPTSRFNPRPVPPDNLERYGVDYRLKDETFQNGDSSIVYQLDLDYLEPFRKENEDIELADPNTGLIVILFAGNKEYLFND